MSDRNRWKRHERQLATVLGTTRLPSNGHPQPDIVAGPFAVESKSRESLPLWLTDAVMQAKRNAGPDQTGMVILSSPRGRGRKPTRLVVLDFGDWLDLHGPLAGLQQMTGEDGTEPGDRT